MIEVLREAQSSENLTRVLEQGGLASLDTVFRLGLSEQEAIELCERLAYAMPDAFVTAFQRVLRDPELVQVAEV